MGSKIRPPGTSMGPFFSKTWYFDGSIFQNFLKFAPKWLKFGTLIGQLFKIFRNLRQNGANFSEKFWFFGTWMGHFSFKMGTWMGGISKIPAAHHYPDQSWVPPREPHEQWSEQSLSVHVYGQGLNISHLILLSREAMGVRKRRGLWWFRVCYTFQITRIWNPENSNFQIYHGQSQCIRVVTLALNVLIFAFICKVNEALIKGPLIARNP